MVMGGCSGVCLECGEHGVDGGLGSKYLADNTMEKHNYLTRKREQREKV
jgi:hypothetical protein